MSGTGSLHQIPQSRTANSPSTTRASVTFDVLEPSKPKQRIARPAIIDRSTDRWHELRSHSMRACGLVLARAERVEQVLARFEPAIELRCEGVKVRERLVQFRRIAGCRFNTNDSGIE